MEKKLRDIEFVKSICFTLKSDLEPKVKEKEEEIEKQHT